MKKIYLTLFLCVISFLSYSCPLPDVQDAGVEEGWNHIVSRRSKTGSALPDENIETVQWLDDFGRVQSTHMVAMSPSFRTIADLTEYDYKGRIFREWLPCSFNFRDESGGVFADHHISVDSLRLALILHNNDIQPFTLSQYGSLLEEPFCKTGPGWNWHNGNHGIKIEHETNSGINQRYMCRKLNVTHVLTDTTFSIIGGGYFARGSLGVTSSFDEDDNEVIVFRDRYGREILERKVVTHASDEEYYDTYMFYDGHDRLVAVLPPALSLQLSDDDCLDYMEMSRYAYLYTYDSKGRLCGKKIPGCDWLFMCYDNSDRIVFSQDGVQRQKGQSSFYLYDVHGRECVKGICNKHITLGEMLDSYVCAKYNGTPLMGGYDYQGIVLDTPELIEAKYYDTYSFMSDFDTFLPNLDYAYGISLSNPSGHLTGQYTHPISLEIEAYDDVWTCVMYDDRGRECHTETSYPDGKSIVTDLELGFTGNPITRRVMHMASLEDDACTMEVTRYIYDHALRLTRVTHTLNDSDEMLLQENTYDEIGRLSSTRKGLSDSLQVLYQYNIRSMLSGIHGELFSEYLFYETPRDSVGLSGYYNGRISSAVWQLPGDPIRHSCDFGYDDAERLSVAMYYDGDEQRPRRGVAYTYDIMGNVRQLFRLTNTGLSKANHSLPLSESTNATFLRGSWQYDGNQLISRSSMTPQYAYDANGNVVSDLTKGISHIEYNVNNQASFMESGHGSEYLWHLGDGTKYSRLVVFPDASEKQSDYRGNAVYENDSLKYLLFDGGLIDFTGDRPEYLFFLTDHLGSIRVVSEPDGTVCQTNDFEPFGVELSLSSVAISPEIGPVSMPFSDQPYRFTGKELYSDMNLGLYDFNARLYDPDICRFTSVDPMAEKYYSVSPYAYCNNNPVIFVDPDGKFIETAWDAANVAMDVASLAKNIASGNVLGAIADGVGLVVDAAAVVLPGVPGGVGAGLKAARAADKAIDAGRAFDRLHDVSKGAGKASDFVHANSAASTKAQHAYDIIDTETGNVVKTGVSSGRIRLDGKSSRAESQVRNWNRKEGSSKYESVITHHEPAGEGARRKIYEYEKKRANAIRSQLQEDKHKRP